MTSTQNQATKQDIKDAALELIKANVSTNNLTIKNHLRAKNFWVSQDEVSSAMKEISVEENLTKFHDNGFVTWSATTVVVSIPTDGGIPLHKMHKILVPASTVIMNPSSDTGMDKGMKVIETISSKLGIYKQAISVNSDLKKDLGFTDKDYIIVGDILGKDITGCNKVVDIIDLL